MIISFMPKTKLKSGETAQITNEKEKLLIYKKKPNDVLIRDENRDRNGGEKKRENFVLWVLFFSTSNSISLFFSSLSLSLSVSLFFL